MTYPSGLTPEGSSVDLSLILPVVNGADYIASSIDTVASTLAETGRTFEVLVICDG